ncbi:MAG: hypothetical protein COA70_12840 [Planctomycetota bacterium]|nr:MAG: hypothetical protein COA70_12840 [Planctomycetota bacterium]
MKSIAAYAFGGLVLFPALTGCAKKEIIDPAEAVLILSSYQAVEDKASVEAANELSILLADLHSCLFPEEGGALIEPLDECYSEIEARMNAWRKHPHPSRPIVFNLKEGSYYAPWDSDHLEQLAKQYPNEKELWSFFEVAAGFMWDSASYVPDTFLSMWIWRNSPLQSDELREFGWEPTIEPSLHRHVAELRFTIDYASKLSVQGLKGVYGNTPEEFKASILNDTQACATFLEKVKNGVNPSAAEVEEAMEGTFIKRQSRMTATALKVFQERFSE